MLPHAQTPARLLRATAILATAALFSASSASALPGPDGVAPAAAPAPVAETQVALNLLAEPRTNAPVVRVRAIGTGSWICSPAGFGRTSRCYRN